MLNFKGKSVRFLLSKTWFYITNYGPKSTFIKIFTFVQKGSPFKFRFINTVDLTKKGSQRAEKMGKKRPLAINWLIPDFYIRSGGHLNIFSLAKYLQDLGHKNRIYILGQSNFGKEREVKKVINKEFLTIGEVEIHNHGEIDMAPCNAIFATSWETAYTVYNFKKANKKFYLVQDFEPYFFPVGSQSVFAENTYRMGFHGITAGPWLAKKLKEEYGMETDFFWISYEKNLYYPRDVERANDQILFYAKTLTPRRAFELGVLALELVKIKYPEVKIGFIGWDILEKDIPFGFTAMGVRKLHELGEIYSKATLGVVLSLTNHSIVTIDMMACKLPVVEIKQPSTELGLKNGHGVILSEPNPHSIAKNIIKLLEDKKFRENVGEKGQKYVKDFVWENAAKDVERAIYKSLL